MHPLLMTMFAEAHSEALRSTADHRRRSSGSGRSWRVFTLRRPRRVARVAHV